MALDEILERTTITLPRGLRVKELKELFKFIVKQIPQTEIVYYADKRVRIGERFSDSKDEPPVRAYIDRLCGLVYSHIETADFECLKEGPKFESIRFFTTPGYELSELPASRLKLMDSVRTAVEKYFSANPQPI